MKKFSILLMLTLCMVSCDSSSSSSSRETDEVAIEEPEFIEQEVTYTCTTCGGSGQVYGYYGPQNCPGCTAYGRSPQYTQTEKVYNPSFKGGSKAVSVKVNGCSGGAGGCQCTKYIGTLTSTGLYKGRCQNSDGWGHTCNHSPENHGLN